MNKFRWAALALWLLAVPLHAQNTPSADVSVQYSPLYVLKGYTIWMNGVSASVERNVTNWLGLAGDLGVYRGHVPENLTGETYLVGPRFTYRKFEKFVPFAQDLFFQSLFGGSHFSSPREASRAGETSSHLPLAAGLMSALVAHRDLLCGQSWNTSAFARAIQLLLRFVFQ